MTDPAKRLQVQIKQSVMVLLTVMAIGMTLFSTHVFAQEDTHAPEVITAEKAGVMKFGLIAAGVAFGLGAIGAGLAISHVGAAAMGAVAEKPEIAGQALIFVALAEGIVVFGFITALMILGKV